MRWAADQPGAHQCAEECGRGDRRAPWPRATTTPGKIAVALRAERRAPSRSSVTDNGIGLPPEHRHRLTEPYVTTRAKGTGLGLAIVRKIMEDHGGEIALGDAESGEGRRGHADFPLRAKKTESVRKGMRDEQERIADRV